MHAFFREASAIHLPEHDHVGSRFFRYWPFYPAPFKPIGQYISYLLGVIMLGMGLYVAGRFSPGADLAS